MSLCKIRPVMREVRDAMADLLEKRTIFDLASGVEVLDEKAYVPMYQI
jgi:DNA-binding IscR family transcriptional regulator